MKKSKIWEKIIKHPGMWVTILVLSVCCLLGAGTLIADTVKKMGKDVVGGDTFDGDGQIYKSLDDTSFYLAKTCAGEGIALPAENTLTESEKATFRNNAALRFSSDPDVQFKILEIVPYKGMGFMGYLVAGEEPINVRKFWNGITNGISSKDTAFQNNNDYKELYKDLGEGGGPLRVNNNYFINTQPFIKNVLADAFFENNYEEATKVFADVDETNKLINNKIDVLVADPTMLNENPHLIEEANFIYVHGMGVNYPTDSFVKSYESEYNPYYDLLKENEKDDIVFYYNWIKDHTNINQGEIGKKISEYVNFEYRVGEKPEGGYTIKPNDISLEVASLLYEKAMEKKFGLMYNVDVFLGSDTGGLTHYVNQFQCNTQSMGTQYFRRITQNNLCKVLILLTMSDESFYKDEWKKSKGSIEVTTQLYHPLLNGDGMNYSLDKPVIADDSTHSITVTTGSHPETDYIWEAKTWEAKEEWLSINEHRRYWGIKNFMKIDDFKKNNVDYTQNDDSLGNVFYGEPGKDYFFAEREKGDKEKGPKENIMAVNKDDPTHTAIYRIATDAGDMTYSILKGIEWKKMKPTITKTNLRILEVEPYTYFHYYEEKSEEDKEKGFAAASAIKKECIRNFQHYFNWITESAIKVDTMPVFELNGNISDLNSKYDVIYFGSLKDNAPELKESASYVPYKRTSYLTPAGITSASSLYSVRDNDLTNAKTNSILEFLVAGKVVLFDSSFYDEIDEGGNKRVNECILQKSSNLYRLAEGLCSEEKKAELIQSAGKLCNEKTRKNIRSLNLYEFDPENLKTSKEVTGAAVKLRDEIKECLAEPVCELECTRREGYYPKEYPGFPPTTVEEKKNYKNDMDYIRISFKIHGVTSSSIRFATEGAAKYRVNLYTDEDSDGYYAGSGNCPLTKQSIDVADANTMTIDQIMKDRTSEDVRDYKICNMKGEEQDKNELEAGVEYYIEKDIKEERMNGAYLGVIPWKLEVVNLANEKMRASEINYTVNTAESALGSGVEKKAVRVLQINYAGGDFKPKQSFSNMVMMCHPEEVDENGVVKTDEEGKTMAQKDEEDVNAYYNGGKDSQNVIWPQWKSAFGVSIDLGNAVKVSRYFREDIKKVPEFNLSVDFLDMDNDFYKLPTNTNMTANDLMQYRKEAWERTTYEEWGNLLSRYTMLVFGFQDMCQVSDSEAFNHALVDFIQSGRSVLFSHDMVMEHNVGTDYKLGKYGGQLRYLCGLDRYHVIKGLDKNNGLPLINSSLLWKNGVSESGAAITKTGLKGAQVKIGNTEERITYYPDNDDGNKSGITDEALWPRVVFLGDNRTYAFFNGKGYKDGRIDRDRKDKNPGWPGGTTRMSITNEGQVTKYPYDVSRFTFSNDTGAKTRQYDEQISIATTHVQYFQADLEANDIAVWGTLSDGVEKNQGIYSSREKDGANQYYTFTRRNVSYTGVGHSSSGMTRDEVDFFINLMIASYRVVPSVPKVEIKNASSENPLTNSYILNVLSEAQDESVNDPEKRFEGGVTRIYFNINSGEWPSPQLDKKPLYIRVIDEDGKHTSQTGNDYKIYRTQDGVDYDEKTAKDVLPGANAYSSAITGALWISSPASIKDGGVDTSVDFEGVYAERHKKILQATGKSSSIPDYYIEVPMQRLREKGIMRLKFQTCVEVEEKADGIDAVQKNNRGISVELTIIPNVLFDLE